MLFIYVLNKKFENKMRRNRGAEMNHSSFQLTTNAQKKFLKRISLQMVKTVIYNSLLNTDSVSRI